MRAESNPETGEFGEGLVEETAGGDAESDVDKDIDQMNSVRILVNSITSFGLLSSSNCIKEALIRRNYQSTNEVLMLLKSALEESIILQIAFDGKLTELLIELDALVDEARELLGSWDNMMSKVYFLLKIERVITRLKGSAVAICQLLISSQPSTAFAENLESIIKKIPLIRYDGTLDNVKGAIEDQMNKRLPKSDNLEKISNALSLSSNQELLMEIVALDKLKSKGVRSDNHAELEFIDHAMAIIIYMHDCYLKVNQLHSINGVPIPPDFCCPLSLQLMFDPVIVASGQTYERAFIKSWIDQGFNVCAKTRQTLAHSNLIPNYTVKALIANWCESNNIKLPDPAKSRNPSLPFAFSSPSDAKAIDGNWSPSGSHHPNNKNTRTSEEGLLNINFHKDLSSSNGVQENYQNEKSLSPRHRSSSPFRNANEFDTGIARKSLSVLEEKNRPRPELRHVNDGGQTSISSKQEFPPDDQLKGGGDSGSASAAVSNDHHEEVGDARTLSRVPSDLTHYSSDASGEVMQEVPASSNAQSEPELPYKFTELRSRSSQNLWRRPSERFAQKIISSPSLDNRPDLSGVETQVRKLVEDLRSDSVDVQRATTEELRLLAKHNMENRIVIANCGSIPLLVGLLHSSDPKTQENAVTALLNLSINDNNKTAIANADAIEPLIHVLEIGNPEAKENSAATLFSLSVIEENKVRIGRSGAIKPLVELLGSGTPRGKKDAATALFNLSIFHENKARIVQAGAVRYLVELMDPAAGMVDKSVAVLANLATIPEGRTAIGHEGGIPMLVEVVELGSARGKENAAAALLQLCTNSNRFCSLVLQEGAVPPLVALSQSGTPRAKEKAQALLSYFRNQRHGNAGRA